MRLEEAMGACRLALQEFMRDRVPLDWAGTQMYLGNALMWLGEREPGTERLEEAVAAYRLALQEGTRERVPLDWAETQMNLGKALTMLGKRKAEARHLEEAVVAWNLCLSVVETAWPSEWVQEVRKSRDEAQGEIARRASAPAATNPQPSAPAAAK